MTLKDANGPFKMTVSKREAVALYVSNQKPTNHSNLSTFPIFPASLT